MTGLNEFLDGYVTAALWSTNDNSDESGGEPLDANYSDDDIAPETTEKMRADCLKFMEKAGTLIEEENYIGATYQDFEIFSRAGHDFWLTRSGSGCGFWDGDWDNGEELTEIANSFGECDLYVGDDGKIYG
jgi:hypothetical protein